GLSEIRPRGNRERLQESGRLCERRERKAQRDVLEAIGFRTLKAISIRDGGVELTYLVRERELASGAHVGRREEAGFFHGGLAEVARPERLLVVNEHRVENADPGIARHAGRGRLEIVVLQIAVLETHEPALIAAGRSTGLDVGRDAYARAGTGRHPEGQIGAFDIELVGRVAAVGGLGGVVGLDIEVPEHDAREIERWGLHLGWRRRAGGVLRPGAGCSAYEQC